jgi:hypothetical protein
VFPNAIHQGSGDLQRCRVTIVWMGARLDLDFLGIDFSFIFSQSALAVVISNSKPERYG